MRLTVLLSMVRISQICYIDYIERLPKKYLILLEFVKRDTPVLLIMCSPFVLKSKICFSFKLVARKLESMGYEHFTSNHSSFIIYILIFFFIYIYIYIYIFILMEFTSQDWFHLARLHDQPWNTLHVILPSFSKCFPANWILPHFF